MKVFRNSIAVFAVVAVLAVNAIATPPQEKQKAHGPRTLENIGWEHVATARSSGDEKHYRKALEVAAKLESQSETRFSGWLLRGHVYHQLHRFNDAKGIARKLVEERGLHHDSALLGDVLFDTGDIDGAIASFQRLMESRPGLLAYTRAGQLRWLKGKTYSAITAMEMAAQAGSARNPEPVAWVLSTLAQYQLHVGRAKEAAATIGKAERLLPGHPRTLYAKAQIQMAAGQFTEASKTLHAVAARSPEPATLWALADCLTASGKTEQAVRIRVGLERRAAADDPRTCSLFLATTGGEPKKALALAQKELLQRQDVFTHDAVAWAALQAGKLELASAHIELALAQGTQNARLFLHAGLIAQQNGREAEAKSFLKKTKALSHMLLPSERSHLETLLTK